MKVICKLRGSLTYRGNIYVWLHLLGLPVEWISDLPGSHDGKINAQEDTDYHKKLIVLYDLQWTSKCRKTRV